jgi:nickel/cobalt transporter (NicO) family protein
VTTGAAARKLGMIVVTLLLFLAAGHGSRADPFTGGSAEPAESAGPASLAGEAMRWLATTQEQLNEAIAGAFHRVRDQHSRSALALILALAFLYGVVHAVGPGHGKSIVASYFVAHHARWTSGIMMGSMISLIQGLSAIVLVGVLAVILQWKQFDILDRGTLVEFVSYGLIVAVGCVMFWRAATGRLHAHDHAEPHDARHHHGHRDTAAPPHRRAPARLDRRLIVATGLTPCASAIIILLFALANDALGVGIVAVAALSIGMALTISAIGVLTVLGRRVLLKFIDNLGVQTHRLEQALATLAALFIIGVSSLMMYGAWLRL